MNTKLSAVVLLWLLGPKCGPPVGNAQISLLNKEEEILKQDEKWNEFKKKHNKIYQVTEEPFRKTTFLRNSQMIDLHNAAANLGVYNYYLKENSMADKPVAEIISTRMGLPGQRIIDSKLNSLRSVGLGSDGPEPTESLDWRDHGLVNPVEDQGQCGSCWAFSAAGALEAAMTKKYKTPLVSLSKQNLVDCSRSEGNFGCDGGWMDYAFVYVMKQRGMNSSPCYPYTATDGPCGFKSDCIRANVSGYQFVREGDEQDLKRAVFQIGPISVAIDCHRMSCLFYGDGIYDDMSCDPNTLNHAVLLIGYGTESGKDYWIIKNSWGTTWGQEGYMKLARNQKNKCGVASMASYPIV